MVSKSPLSFIEYTSLYQRYYDIVSRLHSNIQTILNFYGVNVHGDNHNQNRTAMQEEAREFIIEWIQEYLHDHLYNILANDHIGDLASNITELFIVQAAHLTEVQLYVVVEAILSATDPVWQGFTMLNTSLMLQKCILSRYYKSK